MCVCVCARARACVSVCVRRCVHACVCVCVCVRYRLLIQFIQDDSAPGWQGHLFSLLLFLSTLAQLVCDKQAYHRSGCLGLRMRASLVSAVNRKVSQTPSALPVVVFGILSYTCTGMVLQEASISDCLLQRVSKFNIVYIHGM